MKNVDTVIFDITRLISAEMTGVLSPDESQHLADWRNLSARNEDLYQKIRTGGYLQSNYEIAKKTDSWKGLEDMRMRIGKDRSRRIRKRWLAAIALSTAACLLLFAGIFNSPVIDVVHITPGGPKATLTLSDGSIVELDKPHDSGALRAQGIEVTDNRTITYSPDAEQAAGYNELSVPPGGEYDLVLSDGTRVWLNAGTKIRYPARFTGTERRVSLDGEAYFAVTKDAKNPFVVETGKQALTVLGTEFNISAYGEDRRIVTTLVEGKVKVEYEDQTLELTPGEQSVFNGDNRTMLKRDVNVEEYTGWKDGYILLEDLVLEDIMQKLCRWYRVGVQYEDEYLKNIEFKGRIQRYSNLEEALKLLEMTGGVKFTVKERTVIVNKE